MKQKNSRMFLALLFSFLITMLFGVGFGVLYYFGYIVWGVSIGVFLAGMAFLKYVRIPKWYHVFIAVIWCTLWSLVFNFVFGFGAIVLSVSNMTGVSLGETFNSIMQLIATDPTYYELIINVIIEIVGVTGLGSQISAIYLIVAAIKKYKNSQIGVTPETVENSFKSVQPAVVTPVQVETAQYINVYNQAYKICKDSLLTYLNYGGQEAFRLNIQTIRQNIFAPQSEATKQLLYTHINKILSQENLAKAERRVNEILIKLL